MKTAKLFVTCMFILALTSSFNGIYPEPLYYEIDFNDNVTHLWSRKVMHNYDDNVTKTLKRVDLKYNDMSSKEIHKRAAYQSYRDWEQVFKFDKYVQ